MEKTYLKSRKILIYRRKDCMTGPMEVSFLVFERQMIYSKLLDISMPGMLGTDLVELVRKSKSKFKNMSIIMISAEAEKQTVLKALVNGANDYILKPITKDTVLKKMQNVWQKLPEDMKSNILLRASS